MVLNFRSKDSKPFVGIDISSRMVRVIQISHRADRYQVEAYSALTLPDDVIIDKEIVESEQIADVIERAYNLANPAGKQVVIAVPSSAAITKVVEMDRDLNEEEREVQLRMDAEQHIPYPLDEASLDFEVLQPARTPGRVEVLLVASRTETVDRRAELIDIAGLKPRIVEVESFAVERAYQMMLDSLPLGVRVVGILDIGHHQMTLHVLDGGKMVYSREQSFGGIQLTQEIQDRYGLSREDAEIAKIERNLPDDYDTEILFPFMNALAQQTIRSIKAFFSSSQYTDIDHLLLAGGGANIAALPKLLQDELGYRVTVANPFLRMSVAPQVNAKRLESDAPALLVACGLALRSVN